MPRAVLPSARMSALDVRAAGEHRYAATTTLPDGTSTEHTVLCDPDLLAELGLGPVEEPLFVRRTLEHLVVSAGDGAAIGAPRGELPEVIDLARLHEEHPELMRSVRLRATL